MFDLVLEFLKQHGKSTTSGSTAAAGDFEKFMKWVNKAQRQVISLKDLSPKTRKMEATLNISFCKIISQHWILCKKMIYLENEWKILVVRKAVTMEVCKGPQ